MEATQNHFPALGATLTYESYQVYQVPTFAIPVVATYCTYRRNSRSFHHEARPQLRQKVQDFHEADVVGNKDAGLLRSPGVLSSTRHVDAPEAHQSKEEPRRHADEVYVDSLSPRPVGCDGQKSPRHDIVRRHERYNKKDADGHQRHRAERQARQLERTGVWVEPAVRPFDSLLPASRSHHVFVSITRGSSRHGKVQR